MQGHIKMEVRNLSINWKIGVEVELLAPKGMSRYDLAEAIACEHKGTIRHFFYPQVEPSKVEGKPIFNNLTLAFEILDSSGKVIAQCVDDLTLQDDCDKSHPPKNGWYRIVSDEPRLLQLIMQQCNPAASVIDVLKPIARLFGTEIEHGQGGMIRVADRTGSAIAIAAPLPGERERPCELITPPIENDHLKRLEALLSIARSLGFTAPNEGATHIHFDAKLLESTSTLTNLVRLLWEFDVELGKLVKTNPNCRRLGKWSLEFYNWVQKPDFYNQPWLEAKRSLSKFEITKYCDFNLKNFIHPVSDKYTFEVRIFPVWLDGHSVIEVAGLFEGILYWAINSPVDSKMPASLSELLNELPISKNLYEIWQNRLMRDLN